MTRQSPRDPRPRAKGAAPAFTPKAAVAKKPRPEEFAPSGRGRSHDDSQRAFAGKPDRRHFGHSSYRSFAVVYQDEHIAAVTKPDGLLVTMSEDGEQTLQDQVKRHLRRGFEEDSVDPAPVHRLDRYTSGLVLFGRTRRGLEGLSRLIREGELRKEYYALVVGSPKQKHFTINVPLREYPDGKKRVTVATSDDLEGAQEAISEVTVEEVLPGAGIAGAFALVRVAIMTGRTHQIRVHLAHVGHPVCGDTIYGLKGPNRGLREQGRLYRQFLHARRVAFEHPVTGAKLDLEAKLPKDLVVVLKFLREGGSPKPSAKKSPASATKSPAATPRSGGKRSASSTTKSAAATPCSGAKAASASAKKSGTSRSDPAKPKVRPPKPKKGDKPKPKSATTKGKSATTKPGAGKASAGRSGVGKAKPSHKPRP